MTKREIASIKIEKDSIRFRVLKTDETIELTYRELTALLREYGDDIGVLLNVPNEIVEAKLRK